LLKRVTQDALIAEEQCQTQAKREAIVAAFKELARRVEDLSDSFVKCQGCPYPQRIAAEMKLEHAQTAVLTAYQKLYQTMMTKERDPVVDKAKKDIERIIKFDLKLANLPNPPEPLPIGFYAADAMNILVDQLTMLKDHDALKYFDYGRFVWFVEKASHTMRLIASILRRGISTLAGKLLEVTEVYLKNCLEIVESMSLWQDTNNEMNTRRLTKARESFIEIVKVMNDCIAIAEQSTHDT